MQIAENIRALGEEAEEALAPVFREIEKVARIRTEHVLDCFRAEGVSESMFAPSTGYGFGDRGRDAIDRLAAQIFGAPAGFMRPSLLSGTHTITVALFGILRPGDVMLSLTGNPYDTLLEVVGIIGEPGNGSLRDFGVRFDSLAIQPDGSLDYAGLREKLRAYGGKVKMVYLQRSKGYENRPTLTVAQIRQAAETVHALAAELGVAAPYIVCDNCYGEFTEIEEPVAGNGRDGADILMGSLIKNPGGGMADTGGYIVGTPRAVELCGYRLTCPGVGLEGGASLGMNRSLIKGLFYAPHTVAQAMKTEHFAAYVFERLGFSVAPKWNERRSDIIQTIQCASPERLVAFCGGIQSASPVDAHVSPQPSEEPGYPDPVVMAAGTFVGGSSIELSADGPLRPPYTAYLQGGLTYESGRLGILAAADAMLRAEK